MRAAFLLTLGFIILTHPSVACYDRSGLPAQKRFILNADEAFDSKTGLTWKRCSLGTKLDGGRGCTGEKAFVNSTRLCGRRRRKVMAGTCRLGQNLKA